MDTLAQDLRYAIRQLVRSPGFTIVALVTLVLGIGINTTAFSLVNAVLFRPLPVEEPDRLVRIYTSEWERSGIPSRFFGSSSYPDVVDLEAGLRDVVTGLAAYETARLGLAGSPDAAMLSTAFVGGDFFEVYGIRPTRGRGLQPAETSASAAGNVAVVTEGLWHTQLARDPGVLWRSITLAGEQFTIVGVVRDDVLAPLQDAGVDVILPLAAFPRIFVQPGLMEGRAERWLSVLGRLRPGTSVERAQAALATVTQRIGAEHPAESGDRRYTLQSASTLIGFAGGSAEDIRVMAVSVMAVVGLVLLIAGANLANLLLARASRRGREIAIRLSLGAGRGRVVRQLLTESLVLSLVGGVLASLLAFWAADALRLLPLPAGILPTVDARVLVFTALVAIAAGILFGLAPALRGTRTELAHVMQREGVRTIAGGRSRLRSALVAGQIALSFVLLVAGGLLGRTVVAMRDANPGFDTERVLVASIPLDRRRFDPPAARTMYDRVLERVSAIPGVERASLSSKLAFSGGRSRMSIDIPGYEPGPNESNELEVATVSPGWLGTMGIPIVRGVDLGDAPRGAPVAVINETMAQRYWPGRDALGATFRFGIGGDSPPVTIVGIARDAQLDQLTSAPQPLIIRPIPEAYGASLVLHLRTAGDPAPLAALVREEMRALDADLPLVAMRPLSEVVSARSGPTRLAASSMAAFGALALLLAAVGLYGVMSFLVAQRAPEIGIRIALGAQRGSVLRLVLGDGVRVTAIGVAIGALLALAVTRGLGGTLYGVAPWDPLTFVGIAALLGVVACAATWLPARRAAGVDPAVALRAE